MLIGHWRHLLLLGLVSGCVSPSHGSQPKDIYQLANESILTSSNLSTYRVGGQVYKLESYQCEAKGLEGKQAPFVMVIGQNQAKPWVENVCESKQSKLFYSAGYRLVFFNPPQTGDSTGPYDLGGEKELSAYRAWLSSNRDKPIWGVWSFGQYVTAAARISRELSDAKFAIFSNGIYDLEIASLQSKDNNLKKLIKLLETAEGDAVYDERSVAWDPEGLPKQIFIYHGLKTSLVSHTQAVRFKDSLAASGYDVSLDLLNEQGDYIAVASELGVLEKIRLKLIEHFDGIDKS